MSNVNNAAIDALLDATLDDLADLPEFKSFPDGMHTVTIDWETKTINEHPSVELKCSLVAHVELADPLAEQCAAGTETSFLFMLDNEFGQGNLKKTTAPLAAVTGESTIRGVIEATKGFTCNIVTKSRKDKKTGELRSNLSSLEVA